MMRVFREEGTGKCQRGLNDVSAETSNGNIGETSPLVVAYMVCISKLFKSLNLQGR
jgi:hypothetical protein